VASNGDDGDDDGDDDDDDDGDGDGDDDGDDDDDNGDDDRRHHNKQISPDFQHLFWQLNSTAPSFAQLGRTSAKSSTLPAQPGEKIDKNCSINLQT
jgi:ABC-type Zn2+ transport system substrate-binding protein/surface adhesin